MDTIINAFDWVGAAMQGLDDELHWISEPYRAGCQMMYTCMNTIRTIFSSSPNEPPNLSSAIARWAYLYRYAASYASYVYQLISKSAAITELFQDGSEPNITCIGTGPGSDFLGIVKYILKFSINCEPKFLLLDRYDWGETRLSWRTLCPERGLDTPYFRRIDIAEVSDWQCWQEKLQDTDLFVMSYVLSELHCMKDQAKTFFEWLFQEHKRKCFLTCSLTTEMAELMGGLMIWLVLVMFALFPGVIRTETI